MIEAQFYPQNITKSSTKFFHVLVNIPSDVACKISDETMDEHDYNKLNKEIIGYYERAKPELLESLLKTTKLSRRPLILVHKLISLGNKIAASEEILRHQFIKS